MLKTVCSRESAVVSRRPGEVLSVMSKNTTAVNREPFCRVEWCAISSRGGSARRVLWSGKNGSVLVCWCDRPRGNDSCRSAAAAEYYRRCLSSFWKGQQDLG